MLSAFPEAMPLNGVIGGALIGLAAAIMLLGAGRITGISGLLVRTLGLGRSSAPWTTAVSFIVSLLVGAAIVQLTTGSIQSDYPGSSLQLIFGGLLVGFGARLGSGCTSGHGVCGMSRMSSRSLTATPIFIGSGVITVTLMNLAGLGQ